MYTLFVDTDSDMTPELCKKYGAKLIIMPYTLNDKEIRPYVDFDKFDGKEEFKSFPSGHSCAVMCGLILGTTIPLMNKKWMKYQTLFFYIAFGWGLIVMFSRMLVGAHYLTDTCMGSLLAVVFFYIGNEVVIRKLLPNEEKKEEQPAEPEAVQE